MELRLLQKRRGALFLKHPILHFFGCRSYLKTTSRVKLLFALSFFQPRPFDFHYNLISLSNQQSSFVRKLLMLFFFRLCSVRSGTSTFAYFALVKRAWIPCTEVPFCQICQTFYFCFGTYLNASIKNCISILAYFILSLHTTGRIH